MKKITTIEELIAHIGPVSSPLKRHSLISKAIDVDSFRQIKNKPHYGHIYLRFPLIADRIKERLAESTQKDDATFTAGEIKNICLQVIQDIMNEDTESLDNVVYNTNLKKLDSYQREGVEINLVSTENIETPETDDEVYLRLCNYLGDYYSAYFTHLNDYNAICAKTHFMDEICRKRFLELYLDSIKNESIKDFIINFKIGQ